MQVYLFYRPQTESDVAVGNYLRLLPERLKASMNLTDVHTREGDNLARLYAIMRYPSVLVATDDGRQLQLWHGSLPAQTELVDFLNNTSF